MNYYTVYSVLNEHVIDILYIKYKTSVSNFKSSHVIEKALSRTTIIFRCSLHPNWSKQKPFEQIIIFLVNQIMPFTFTHD